MPFDPMPVAPEPALSDAALPAVPQGAPPVTVGALVSRTFSTWAKQVWRFAAMALVLGVPLFALFVGVVVAITASHSGVEDLEAFQRWLMYAAVGFWIVLLLAAMVQACGNTYAVIQHLSGQPARLGRMLAVGLGRILPVVVLFVLGVLALFAVGYLLGLVNRGLVWLLDETFGSIVLLLGAVPAACVVATAISLTLPALVAERRGPFRALARSWQLSRGRRGAIFLALALVVILLAALVCVETFAIRRVIATSLAAQGGAGRYGFGPEVWITLAVSAIVQLLVLPLLSVAPAVAYHDVRIEKEGTSTEELARVFG